MFVKIEFLNLIILITYFMLMRNCRETYAIEQTRLSYFTAQITAVHST